MIDPGQSLSAVRDVAILHGRIARIDENIPRAQARQVFDATDKTVTPELIDDISVMRTAREIADQTGVPIMMHWSTEPDLLAIMKAGDIRTYPFNPPSENSSNVLGGQLTQAEEVLPQILELKDRGIFTDGQLATTRHQWEVSEKATSQGWFPDAISTDVARNSDGTPASVLVPMSQFLHLGLSLEQVIERVTTNPARMFDYPETVGSFEPWHLDRVFVRIQGRLQYLWRAIDEDGDACALSPRDSNPPPDTADGTATSLIGGCCSCPSGFELRPTENRRRKQQLDIVAGLCRGADELVCATDAGREGELIFRYLLRVHRLRRSAAYAPVAHLADRIRDPPRPCRAQTRHGLRQPIPGRAQSQRSGLDHRAQRDPRLHGALRRRRLVEPWPRTNAGAGPDRPTRRRDPRV